MPVSDCKLKELHIYEFVRDIVPEKETYTMGINRGVFGDFYFSHSEKR